MDTIFTLLGSRLLPDDGGSVMPLIATLIFVSFFVLMFLFVLTDRRRAHHRRMEHLILDDSAEDPWLDSSRNSSPPKDRD